MFVSHKQLQMYDFSDVVNLLCNPPGTTLHLQCGALRCESHETQVTINKLKEL